MSNDEKEIRMKRYSVDESSSIFFRNHPIDGVIGLQYTDENFRLKHGETVEIKLRLHMSYGGLIEVEKFE